MKDQGTPNTLHLQPNPMAARGGADSMSLVEASSLRTSPPPFQTTSEGIDASPSAYRQWVEAELAKKQAAPPVPQPVVQPQHQTISARSFMTAIVPNALLAKM